MVAVRLAEAAVFCLIIVKYHVAGRVPKGIIAIRFRDVALAVSIVLIFAKEAEPGAPLLGCGSDCLDVRANEVRKQERSRARAGPAQGRLGSNQGEREGEERAVHHVMDGSIIWLEDTIYI